MNDPQAGVEMPRYKSHKEVWALQIDKIEKPNRETSDFTVHFVKNSVYAPRRVAPMVFARGEPQHGDYLVVYRDGYESWSPALEFEDGYTLV